MALHSQRLEMKSPDGGPASFAFLSETSFVIPSLGIDIYRFFTDGADVLVTRTASLDLPPMEPHAKPYISIVPPQDVRPRCDGQVFPPNHSTIPVSPFGVAVDTHCVEVRRSVRLYGLEEGMLHLLSFFIPIRLLCRFSMSDIPLTLPWESWSKGIYVDDLGTEAYFNHFFPETESVHGGRVVMLGQSLPDSSDKTGIFLLDFNQRRAKRRSAITPNISIPEECLENAEPDGINRDVLMATNILPVHVSTRTLHWSGHPRLMCDEEHIVLEGCAPCSITVVPSMLSLRTGLQYPVDDASEVGLIILSF